MAVGRPLRQAPQANTALIRNAERRQSGGRRRRGGREERRGGRRTSAPIPNPRRRSRGIFGRARPGKPQLRPQEPAKPEIAKLPEYINPSSLKIIKSERGGDDEDGKAGDGGAGGSDFPGRGGRGGTPGGGPPPGGRGNPINLIGPGGYTRAARNPPPLPMNLINKLKPHRLHTIQELSGMRPDKPKKTIWPLFRFGIAHDTMYEFSILDKIFVRCFKNLVEAVIMEGTRTSEISVLAFFINHVDARVYVSIPIDTDPKRLRHIANAYKDTNVSQFGSSLRQLYRQS